MTCKPCSCPYPICMDEEMGLKKKQKMVPLSEFQKCNEYAHEQAGKIHELAADARKLRDALEWYSVKENHHARTVSAGCVCCMDVLESVVSNDEGERAREAIREYDTKYNKGDE